MNASPPPFLFSSVLCQSVHLLTVAGWQQAPVSAGSHPEELDDDDDAGAQTQVAASTAFHHRWWREVTGSRGTAWNGEIKFRKRMGGTGVRSGERERSLLYFSLL